MSRLMIFCALLTSAGNLAFAEEEKSTSAQTVSPDWKRAQKGLEKAKPIPQPSQTAAPKTTTESGGVAGFDPKTGETTNSPSAEAPAPSDPKPKVHKPDGQSKSDGGEKRK